MSTIDYHFDVNPLSFEILPRKCYFVDTKLSKNFFPVSTPRNKAALAGKARSSVGPSPPYSPTTPRSRAILKSSGK